MDIRLINFLKKRTAVKGTHFTHTSKIQPLRSYNIANEDMAEFWDIYNTVISEKGVAGVTEKPENVVPLIVDVDFRYKVEGDEPKRLYTSMQVEGIVKVYQDIISDIAEEATPKMLLCCLLEKIAPRWEGGIIHDGFHLTFPHFFAEQNVQKKLIRKRAIEMVKEKGILPPILGELEKVFDENVPRNCWLLYGSRKEPGSEAYLVSKYYDGNLKLLSISDVFVEKPQHGTRNNNLPRYLSIRQGEEATPLRADVVPVEEETPKESKVRETTRTLSAITADIDTAGQLVGMLADHRAEDYSEWMEVGWVLYNISEGQPAGMDLWVALSQRSDKFQEGECEKLWDKMEIKQYTLGTLKYLANIDSPEL